MTKPGLQHSTYSKVHRGRASQQAGCQKGQAELSSTSSMICQVFNVEPTSVCMQRVSKMPMWLACGLNTLHSMFVR